MENIVNFKMIFNSLAFTAFGLILFAISYIAFEKLTPGNFWKEILEEHNTALAIMVGAVTIGLAMIISAAVHG